MTASLAYRTNEAAIRRGDVPEKYLRLLPYINGERVLEVGSAEGVLACLLARAGKVVAALEKSSERHASAIRLASEWGVQPALFNGAIGDRLDLLEGIDTLVGIRTIYYWGASLDPVFAAAADHVPNVVLCGNKNRAARWKAGQPNDHDRADNYYASAEGMRAVLTRHGYEIAAEVLTGDPIVVGRR